MKDGPGKWCDQRRRRDVSGPHSGSLVNGYKKGAYNFHELNTNEDGSPAIFERHDIKSCVKFRERGGKHFTMKKQFSTKSIEIIQTLCPYY